MGQNPDWGCAGKFGRLLIHSEMSEVLGLNRGMVHRATFTRVNELHIIP
jgi:hypothetical protein